MESGHWTAFCSCVNSGRWHKFDDQQMYQLNSVGVQSSAGYIFFYLAIDGGVYLTRDGPEYLLYKMLEVAPRPFFVRDDGRWELRYRRTGLYTYIIGLAIVVPILVNNMLNNGSLNFEVILWVSALVLGWKTYVHFPLHVIIIDKTKNVYEYRKRGRLITREPLYNMYIRLIGQKCYPSPGGSKSSNWFFYLCLKGVGLEEFKLSPHTEYEDRMRKLGKRLSRKLGINYFDFIDESPLHDVRHRPVQMSIPTWAPA